MSESYIRSLVVAVAVCPLLLTMMLGWGLTRYSLADSDPATLRSWAATPGVTFSAREYLLTEVDPSDSATIDKRRRDLTGMLAVRPLSSMYWLDLAEAQLLAREQPSRAIEAFTLSTLTGAHEGGAMWERSLFGFANWEILPADIRQRVVSDFRARRMTDRDLARARAVLSKRPEKTRQDIRSALEFSGFPTQRFAAVGL